MSRFRRVAVYCGSSNHVPAVYFDAAREFGELLVRRGLGLVFGGGRVGLMGAVADAVLAAGGEAIGVIPHKLRDLEVAHRGLTELLEVDSMHARKSMMASMADAFVALPGGFGTLDEIFEVTTWNQLGYHKKPAGLLNVDGYFDGLEGFIRHAVDAGFVRNVHRDLLLVDADPASLLDRLEAAELPDLQKWIDKP
ncbi:MAG: TIGR00730 family Rossman fold protein [Myxococcales bacterium]|nr:TIGR00730 family Rossman fold protein [Myxococcales bacterium]